MKSLEISFIFFILLISFFVSFYFGHQGLMPLDDLQNFNSGYRVLSGDFPFRDYYSVTGPLLDIWQSNFYKIFGVNWQSFIIHSSLLNCIYSISIFLFLKKMEFNLLYSFFYSISAGLLMYPTAGNPTVEHHSLILSTISLFFFIVGLKEKNNFFLFISIFIFGLSFFIKQVPTAYFFILCSVIYLSQIFCKISFSNFFNIIISSFLILFLFLIYFLLNDVSLITIFNQYFIIASDLGSNRFSNINFNTFYENVSKLYFLLFLLIPSLYISFVTKKTECFLLIFGLSLIIIFYEIHSNNQPITFALLPVFLFFFHYSYKNNKLNLKFIEYFFYLIITYAFYRILRFESFYIIILLMLILFNFYRKIPFNFIIIIYLFITTSLYFEKYVKTRAWDDLKKDEIISSFDANTIDQKLKGLKWKTVYFSDTKKEKKFIKETLNYLRNINSEINYILISDYQIYNPLLNRKDYSPVKYWFKDATYPNKDHELRNSFEEFFKKKILDNNVSQIIIDNTAKFKSNELKEFEWLNKCLMNKEVFIQNSLDIFIIKKNCII